MASNNVTVVTDNNFESEVLQSDLPIVIDFWATWCGPCKAISPLVDQLAQQYEGKVRVGKLDVQSNQQTAARFNITGIPAFLVFKSGKVVDQLIGANPRKVHQLFENAG